MGILQKDTLICCWGLLLCLGPLLGFGQQDIDYLQLGQDAYDRDQLDSATYFYQQAYEQPLADTRLEGLAGLVKVAVLRAELESADSLLTLGKKLLQAAQVGLKARSEFQLMQGEYYRRNGQLQEALELLRGVLKKRASLGENSLQYTRALYFTAVTFEQLTVFDSSLFYMDLAYKGFQQHLDTTSVRFAGIYNSLGVCYFRANRYTEAKTFFQKSKTIAENRVGPVSTDLAMCLNNLSSISRAEENYREAIDYSEQALRIYRALKDDNGMSSAYYALGVYHYYLGDYGRTKDFMEACIAIRERIYEPAHYSLIGPYEVLGIAAQESGDDARNLYYLNKVRPVIIANYGPGSVIEAYNYENTALSYQAMGELDSALYFMKRAHAVIKDKVGPTDYSLATHYFSYANLLYLRKEWKKAAELLEVSSRIYEALELTNTIEYAQGLSLNGLLAAQKQDWVLADQFFEEAMARVRWSEQVDSFQVTPDALLVLNDYTGYLFQRYQATQSPDALASFERYSQLYLQLSDQLRKQFNDPYTKSVLIKDNTEVYNRNIGFYFQLYRQTGNQQYLNTAYRFAEYGRASLLRDLQDDKIKSYAGVPDSMLQKESTLKKKIADLNQQLMENPDAEAVKAQLFTAKEAFNAYTDQILEANPRYYDLKFNARLLDLPEVQSRLIPGQNLIEYMQDDTAYYALVLSPETKAWFYLGSVPAIDKAVDHWRQGMIQQDDQAVLDYGYTIYEYLWQPLESSLKGNRVVIIPTGPLFYLNFETLPKTPDPNSFLIHSFNISYALSLHLYYQAEAEPEKKGPLLAVAPGFETALKEQYRQQLDTLDMVDEEYLKAVRQPWSLQLVNTLKQQYANRVLTGMQATESRLKATINEGRLLLFGTHAVADAHDPLRSRLVLAKESGAQIEDGYLHAYELYGLPLKAELAVLNACESGLGKVKPGEGMISLAYSIHYAGCPSTMMSLWKVDEKISTTITKSCLDYLAEGLDKSEALRQAKLDYLETAEGAVNHPFYWGGMVLLGKDGPVHLQPKRGWWWLGAIGFFIFLTGIYFYFRTT